MSIQSVFKVTIKSSKTKAADPLGSRRPFDRQGGEVYKIRPNTVARAYSIDINMSPHCTDFSECPIQQKKMICKFISQNLKFISQANIYAENKSFRRNQSAQYDPNGSAKLHWHGIIRLYPEFDTKSSVDALIKDMRKSFSSPSATCTFRAVFCKKIRNSQHLSDRVTYQTKQLPVVIQPINYNNTIPEKPIEM